MLLLKNNIFHIDDSEIFLIPFGDWHIGSEACDMDLIKDAIKEVKTNPKCYAIIAGDLMEMVTYHSKGSLHHQKYFANKQKKIVEDLLRPIKHKILFALIGNHERRSVKETTLDVMEDICNHLGIEYRGAESHFVIRLKDRFLRCYAHHNTGGGTTPGAKINRLVALHYRSPFADLIIAGHTHDIADTQKLIPFLDNLGNMQTKRQHFICVGSCLKSDIGYACENAYPPIPTCVKLIHVKHKGTSKKLSIVVTMIQR